jgi:transcriptional regulator with XRE-family HTH domain
MEQIKNIVLLQAIRLVLKDLRSSASLSQDAVITDIYDLKKITINLGRIEAGDGNISPSTLFLLCEYYKISISDFFKRVEEVDEKLKIRNFDGRF